MTNVRPGGAQASPRKAVVEVFAGVGSVARGFEAAAPFTTAYLCDTDPICRATYLANGGDESTYEIADVRKLNAERVRDRVGNAEIAGLLGCPPCQGWSTAGRRRPGDERNSLMVDFFRLVSEVEPRFVVMENVPVVASRPELDAACRTDGAAYEWWVGVLNAGAYGLPQSRQRTVAIGYHRSLRVTPTPPPPTHGGATPVWDYGSSRLVVPSADSVDQLLGGAPKLKGGPGRHGMSDLYTLDIATLPDLVTVGAAIGDLDGGGASAYARALGAGSVSPSDHEPWGHRRETVARMATVVEGAKPETSRTYFSQAYARLHRRGLARTVTTNFHNPGSGRFWHYCRDRTITLREAARLQGFRDDFVFTGTRSERERQIGNAFPVIWAEAIAAHVWTQLGPRSDLD